jgi:hypothetical protein
MSVGLYMNVHICRQITEGLRQRGVDVLTAQEDGTTRLPDSELLDRATELGRVLFTEDRDLLREAARRQKTNEHFAGLIYVPQNRLPIGQCIQELELLAKVGEPEDFANQIIFLPLK